jgi:hypothetical protein
LRRSWLRLAALLVRIGIAEESLILFVLELLLHGGDC